MRCCLTSLAVVLYLYPAFCNACLTASLTLALSTTMFILYFFLFTALDILSLREASSIFSFALTSEGMLILLTPTLTLNILLLSALSIDSLIICLST